MRDARPVRLDPLRAELLYQALHGIVGLKALQALHDVAQQELQNAFVLVGDVDQPVEPRVPVVYHRPQRDDGQHRPRQGDEDAEHDAPVAGAVDHRGVLHRLVDGHDEVARDDDVERRDRRDDHQNPARVDHAQVPHQQVGGNDASLEEQREHEQEGDHPSPGQVALRERVRGAEGDEQRQGGAEHDAVQRVQVGGPYVVLPEHEHPRLGTPLAVPEVQPPAGQRSRRRQRGGDDGPERIQDRQREQAEEQVVGDVERATERRHSDQWIRHAYCSYQTPYSL